jgi:hypothetical protein
MGRVLLNAALERGARRRVQGVGRWLEISRHVEPRVIPDHAEPKPEPATDDKSTN